MNNLYANPATQPKYRALQQSSCFISPPSDYPNMDTAIRTSASDDESAADTHGTVFAYPDACRQGLLTIKLHDISAATVYTSLGVACMNILSPARSLHLIFLHYRMDIILSWYRTRKE